MSHPRPRSIVALRTTLTALFLLFSISCEALSASYCSPDNVAGSNEVVSPYMSNGLCQDNCKSSYVFAVIQGQSCWCTNYAPANTVSNSQCNSPCPGYPDNLCGNPGSGLFGYFNLGGIPSGTSGGGGGSSPTSQSSPSSPIQSTSSLQSTSTSDTDTVSASSTQPSPTTAASVITSVISITGKASTILVTPSSSPIDSSLGQSTQAASKGSGGLGGGAVAGIVIGVAIIIGIVIGCAVFFWLRKKHRRNLEAVSEGGSVVTSSHGPQTTNGIPSRQVSQMSSAGLLSRSARTNTAAFSESNGGGTLNSDRNSSHMTVDQRLNPWAIYSNEISRNSNVSLQDNQDYSRQLRVANPDP